MTLPYCDGPEFTCFDRMTDMPKTPRFRVMCIPGNREDGSDSAWFVFDYKTKKSKFVADGDAGWTNAMTECRRLNKDAK